MKNTNYTKDKKGLQKMRALIANSSIFMMATNLKKIPFSVCPMTLQEMDEQGDLWFFTSKDSDHFRAIGHDDRVQLIESNEKDQQYLSIYGNATHIIDNKKVNHLWSSKLNTWFKGQDDPNLALININMEIAYYWDNNESKLVSLFDSNDEESKQDKPQLGQKGYINLQNH